MSNTKRDVGIAIAALLVGAVVGYFLGKADLKSVPPPPFTGASFGNGDPSRVIKTVKAYGWNKDATAIPMTEADQKKIADWTGDMLPKFIKTLDPLAPHYYATTEAFGEEDIIRMAVVVVVEVTNSTGVVEETYINFVPDGANLDVAAGISHLNSWLTPGDNPVLNVTYFYGMGYFPNTATTDAGFYLVK